MFAVSSRGSAFKAATPGNRPARRSMAALAAAARAPGQEQQQQMVQGLDRRAALLAVGAVAVGTLAPAAALAAECELQTSKSGLQWCEVEQGSGDPPVQGARIRAHYRGTLASGAVFDSSYERGRPLIFQIGIGQVIKGWDQGILGSDDVPPMLPGGKRRLVIPAELGYGSRGAGGVIPPGATLYFDVEYLGSANARR